MKHVLFVIPLFLFFLILSINVHAFIDLNPDECSYPDSSNCTYSYWGRSPIYAQAYRLNQYSVDPCYESIIYLCNTTNNMANYFNITVGGNVTFLIDMSENNDTSPLNDSDYIFIRDINGTILNSTPLTSILLPPFHETVNNSWVIYNISLTAYVPYPTTIQAGIASIHSYYAIWWQSHLYVDYSGTPPTNITQCTLNGALTACPDFYSNPAGATALAIGGLFGVGKDLGLAQNLSAIIFTVIISMVLSLVMAIWGRVKGKTISDIFIFSSLLFLVFFSILGWFPAWLMVVLIIISAFTLSGVLGKMIGG